MSLTYPQVVHLQQSLNARLRARGRPQLQVDGEYGPATAAAVHLVKYLLGFPLKSLDHGPSPFFRRVVLHPQTRNEVYLARAADRLKYLHAQEANKPLRLQALDIGRGLLGVMEEGGNNRGPMVSKIILANGGVIGEPWCGDFVAWCYRQCGSRAVNRSWASVFYLGRVAGLRTVKDPLPGDIVRYSFSHTGLFVRWIDRAAGIFEALEGNTGPAGAVSDGNGHDGVYLKHRHVTQVDNFRRVTR